MQGNTHKTLPLLIKAIQLDLSLEGVHHDLVPALQREGSLNQVILTYTDINRNPKDLVFRTFLL
jgi:hypothetical protein